MAKRMQIIKVRKSFPGVLNGSNDPLHTTHRKSTLSTINGGSRKRPDKIIMNGKTNQAVKAFGKKLIFRPSRLNPLSAVGKAHVRQYLRRTKSGKTFTVRDHEDNRRIAINQPKPMSLRQGSYILDLLGFSQFKEIKKIFLTHFNLDTGLTDLSSKTASKVIRKIHEYYDEPKKRIQIISEIQHTIKQQF